MVNGEVLALRYKCTEEYLYAISGNLNWEAQYDLLLEGDLSAPHTMALLRPEAYGEEVRQRSSLIRGKRAFGKTDRQRCQSDRFWGYTCPLGTDSLVSADHVFPYSLGGITEAPNLLWLCDAHNRLKGGDVHVFPWELGTPSWVPPTLVRIAAVVRRLQFQTDDDA